MALATSLLTMLPLLAKWVSTELLSQLQASELDPRSLPQAIRKLFRNQELEPLEMTALSILLQASVDQEASVFGGKYTAGIPPPSQSSKVPTA